MKKLFLVVFVLVAFALLFFIVLDGEGDKGSNDGKDGKKNSDTVRLESESARSATAETEHSGGEVLVRDGRQKSLNMSDSNKSYPEQDGRTLNPFARAKKTDGEHTRGDKSETVQDINEASTGDINNGDSGQVNNTADTQDYSQKAPRVIPVSQAAQYFIPKEQRAPGRLGGPPPLPATSQATQGGIQPPEAPGADTSGQSSNLQTPPPAFQ